MAKDLNIEIRLAHPGDKFYHYACFNTIENTIEALKYMKKHDNDNFIDDYFRGKRSLVNTVDDVYNLLKQEI